MLKILKSLAITLLLVIAVGVGFYVTNQQNHAYAVDGACFWKDSGRVQCKFKNWATSSISFFANLPDAVSLTPSDLPIVGGAFSKFDPVEWDKQLGDAVNGNCFVSDCDDYIFRPDLSANAGYPVYDSDTKSSSGNSNGKYLHFVSNNPLYGFLTNSPDKISPIPQKDNNKWIPIGNTSNALKGDPDDDCSLRKTNNCKIRDSVNYSSAAPYDSGAFLQTVRNIVALERLKQQCEKEAPLSFVTCPIYEAIVDGISNLIGGQGVSGERQGLIIDFLTITPLEAKAGQQPVFQQIVGNVVTVANIFYVIIFLLLIFSSSLPFGLDNYTIKKTLPKFIGAVIMTQFAYLICGVIIDFFNLLGTIVPNLIFSLQAVKDVVPSGGGSDAVSAGLAATIVVGGAGATALLASVGWILLIILAFIAIIAILVGFVYMVLRYLVLYILILLAPIAFASWVLPGTEKFFKSWWKNFIRLNAMFPMITGMLAVAILISRVLVTNPAGGASGGALSLIAMIIPIVALLAIPRTLKWTTDGMNAIAGKVLGATSGKIGAGGAAVSKGAKTAAKKGMDYGKKETVAFGKRRAAEMGLGTQKFQRRETQKAAEEARARSKEEIANLNRTALRASAATAATAAGAAPKNAKTSGTFKANIDKLIETGDSVGLARVMQEYHRSASAAGLTDDQINDNWINALGSNYGIAKEMSPTFAKASNATTINASATSNVDVSAAGGHGAGEEYVQMSEGDFTGMGEDKLRAMDTDMIKSVLTSVGNGASMDSFKFDQASVEKALTEPGSTFKSAETRKALQTIAATKGWRYQ